MIHDPARALQVAGFEAVKELDLGFRPDVAEAGEKAAGSPQVTPQVISHPVAAHDCQRAVGAVELADDVTMKAEIAGSVLDCADVRDLGQLDKFVRAFPPLLHDALHVRETQHRPAEIDHDPDVGCVRDFTVVALEARETGIGIVGRRDHDPIAADFLAKAGQFDRQCSAGMRAAPDHGHAPGSFLCYGLDDLPALLVGERIELARAAGGDDIRGALLDIERC